MKLLNFQQVQAVPDGSLIGYLGDISEKGVRVLRKGSFETGGKHRLRLKYVFLGGTSLDLEFDVEAIWDRAGEDLPYREIGFGFIEPATEMLGEVRKIVEDIKSRLA